MPKKKDLKIEGKKNLKKCRTTGGLKKEGKVCAKGGRINHISRQQQIFVKKPGAKGASKKRCWEGPGLSQ